MFGWYEYQLASDYANAASDVKKIPDVIGRRTVNRRQSVSPCRDSAAVATHRVANSPDFARRNTRFALAAPARSTADTDYRRTGGEHVGHLSGRDAPRHRERNAVACRSCDLGSKR